MSLLQKWHIALVLLPGLFLGGQTLDVTFRYIPDPDESFVRIFVPGTMPEGTANDWGPNSSGYIAPSAPSIMERNILNGTWEKTYSLAVGSTHHYKFYFHYNNSGSDGWITDPLNPFRTNDYFQNAILTVTDPLVFQSSLHFDVDGKVTGLSSGIFTNSIVDSIFMQIGSDTIADGLTYYNSGTGVFYYDIETPLDYTEGFLVKAFVDTVELSVINIGRLEIVKEPLPAGIQMGPNYDAGVFTVAVLAPGHPFLQLGVSSSSDINNETFYPMKNDTDNPDIWWLDLEGLNSGDLTYAFRLTDGTSVSDPLSRRVLNNRTLVTIGSGGVTTADDFLWTDSLFTIPDLDTLFIYELHVDDFASKGSANGRFSHVVEKLDHLRELGVNAIELMPIMEFPGNRSWGYHNTHYAAVESTYGTPEDFKNLVNTAHSLGIAVILDIVWNHANGSNPLWEIQPDISANPYVKADSDLRPGEDDVHFGGVDLDHFMYETQAFVRQVHNIWVEEYHIDGFRFDFTRGIGWSTAWPDYGILGWTTALAEDHPDVIQIAEHLPADPNLVKVSALDAAWHDSFHDRLNDEIFGSNSMSTIENQIIGLREYDNSSTPYQTHNSAVKYTVSHDEQSLIQEMVEWKSHSIEKALRRDLLFSTLLFTSQGIPMIWQGQEFGMKSGWLDQDNDGEWDDDKLAYRPMDWSLETTETGQRHFMHYVNLATIYKKHPAVRNGYFSILERYPTQKTIVYGNTDPGNSHGLIVIANMGSSSVSLADIPVFYDGNWYPVLGGGKEFTATSMKADSITIPGYTAYIYSNVVWETLGIQNEKELSPPDEFSLMPAYPNPFNPETNIRFFLPEDGDITLTVFDLLGREVERLIDTKMKRGIHSLTWNANEYSSGVYYIRLAQGNKSSVEKLMLLK